MLTRRLPACATQLPAFAVSLLLGTVLAGTAYPAGALKARLQPLIEAHEGQAAVAVKHLGTGEVFLHRADEPMPTASLIKVAVLIEAYRQSDAGELDLDSLVTLRAEDKVPGSGILAPHFSPGAQLSLRDCLRLMMAWSDNTATNLVLERVGLKPVNDTMERLGLAHTKIHAQVFRRETSILPDRSRQFGLGSTTAAEMLALFERLHHKELISAAASEQMLEHLLACQDKDRLPRLLPTGTKVAHKTGAVSAVRCDAGLILAPSGAIAVCVLTSENKDQRWSDDNAGNLLCAKISEAVYDYFESGSRSETSAEPEPLAEGATGELVEALQRTLNARLAPAPDLSIDGDFGPATRAALVRFQTEQGLEPTGIVSPETWEALGTLITQDAPVPDPAEVNQAVLEVEPAESLDDPPLVTAKAWAVADANTGDVLWGRHDEDLLPMASTTKVMTALVVLELAAQDARVLDEQVVFSRRADETSGSTAGLRSGERTTVRELLYGLLLPSGNDAAVALAEHFGGRCGPIKAPRPGADAGGPVAGDGDPLESFVAEMNRTAARLDLAHTSYANPHGLDAADHRTTARDLARLGWTAMRNPLFRQFVRTRQHGVTVTGEGGYRRNVLWKNTNHLLPIDGYDGIKTGTTSSAGACLVSCGHRGDDALVVVVLGSSSPEGRYIDTRNLFRWAWRQRGDESATSK